MELDHDVFWIDDGGELRGTLGSAYMQFAYEAKGSYDGPDGIADIHGKDKYGAPLCPPPGALEKKQEDTVYDRAFREGVKRRRQRRQGRHWG